ncbi:hypothetical protein SKAU_G00229660 [Synaphobranchus kaupii]|uniref:Uncharacterized protein n=1 Tax=Synaphobranchus kaupii TaxID=118154 RepID=A0A9Q1IS85_SYNKA|nr:hypothetical protein SKAU_G00229660 [Synaphobranchus kaupii]
MDRRACQEEEWPRRERNGGLKGKALRLRNDGALPWSAPLRPEEALPRARRRREWKIRPDTLRTVSTLSICCQTASPVLAGVLAFTGNVARKGVKPAAVPLRSIEAGPALVYALPSVAISIQAASSLWHTPSRCHGGR